MKSLFAYTISWRDDEPPPLEVLLADPRLARYIAGWPRPGDDGVIAVDGSGVAAGAAWYRLFDERDPGFGFVSANIPELGIAVVPGQRGRGLGSRLMEALISLAGVSGHTTLSLSVEDGNARAARLYERLGFVRVGQAGTAWTMVRRAGPIFGRKTPVDPVA